MEIETYIATEIEAVIDKMKDIYSDLMNYIDANDDLEDEFEKLIKTFEKYKVLENKGDIILLFLLISKISDNHHPTSNINDKLEKIFRYLIKDVNSSISDFIIDYDNYNKKIIFLLLEKKLIRPDKIFLEKYLNDKHHFFFYLFPKMKEYLEEEKQIEILKEIQQKFNEDLPTFEKKCKIGENDSYICSLIRSDSVEEFITYVNKTNFSLSATIKPSIYETNLFLIDKMPTLIEYAAFFGSIQIIRYLKYNKVPLTHSLMLYAIHSNNPELIHFLEENDFQQENDKKLINKKFIDKILIESIKCHHNAISNYIKDNFYEQVQTDDYFYDKFSDIIINSLNFFFFPNESIICKQRNKNEFNQNQLRFLLTQITISSSATSIRKSAYIGNLLLSRISFSTPSSVTSIGNYAFYGCSSLTEISIPSSVTSIGNGVFYKCLSLTRISIPSSVTSIGDYVFCGCSSLRQISFEIPSSLISIGNFAFSGCSSLIQISIPSSVTSIGDYVFGGCSSLIQIPNPSSIPSNKSNIDETSLLLQTQTPSSTSSIKVEKPTLSLLPQIKLVDIIRDLSIPIKTEKDCPQIFKLPSIITNTYPNKKLRKIIVGPPKNCFKKEVKILIVGSIGQGKTTILNYIANYLYGVEWNDDFRFKVVLDGDDSEENVDSFRSTNYITAYTLYWQPGFAVPYTVTLIDTPGISDTRRVEYDKEVISQIESFFKNENGCGFYSLNAVALVMLSTLNSHNMHYPCYMFDSLKKLFGNDIANNLITIGTFADASDDLLDALDFAQIPKTYFCKFNNFSLSESIYYKDILLKKVFWDMGKINYANLFEYINNMEPKSLK